MEPKDPESAATSLDKAMEGIRWETKILKLTRPRFAFGWNWNALVFGWVKLTFEELSPLSADRDGWNLAYTVLFVYFVKQNKLQTVQLE